MRSAASNIGTVIRDKQDLRQALSWFERAVKLDDGDANLEIARIYLRKGNEIKAVRYLRQTLKAKADDVTEGSKDEARRILRQLTKATR
jgi:TPR repeat protein